MLYNIFLTVRSGPYHLLGLGEKAVKKLVQGFHNGDTKVWLNGVERPLENASTLRIFKHEMMETPEEFRNFILKQQFEIRNSLFPEIFHFPPKILQLAGEEVTNEFLDDLGYGESRQLQKKNSPPFIAESRLKELEGCRNPDFDLSKLIKLCQEINHNYEFGNFFSVGILARAIIDHVPPIFVLPTNLKSPTFAQYVSQLNGKRTQRDQMERLDQETRKIADGFVHLQIRCKEPLPTASSVAFQPLLDALLSEIIVKCH